MSNQSYRVNDRIRIREVRLIDEEGNNVGILATRDARDYAASKGLDLVEVAPDARPPVCRVMDYGKFMYEQTKKERAARKGQKQVEIKGLRIHPDTDSYHISFKVKQARSFLLKGNKVRISCRFRGRERSHPEIARAMMTGIFNQLKDIATVEQSANFEGRNMTMVLTPDPVAVEKAEREKQQRLTEMRRTGRQAEADAEEAEDEALRAASDDDDDDDAAPLVDGATDDDDDDAAPLVDGATDDDDKSDQT